jgi:DAACS family dicarboxylate/amino acid:cation (Na+ or H+) symporter
MPAAAPTPPSEPDDGAGVLLWRWWDRTPLYARILGGFFLGMLVGVAVRYLLPPVVEPLVPGTSELWSQRVLFLLETPSNLVMRLLGALAAPLVLVAVVQALMHAKLSKGSGLRLVSLLLLNTVVAILIGLVVANTLRPGKWMHVEPRQSEQKEAADKGVLEQFLENVPRSLLGPLTDEGKVISVVILAIAFGIALRRVKEHPLQTVADLVEVAFRALITILHWIVELIPLAVFGIVAGIIAKEGFGAILNLGAFVVAVLLGLSLQATWYLLRIRFWSWASPWHVLAGMRDALVMAFSTASSTATMPVTYACLRQKVGLREQSASLGALVGANFNNDGTALYEAMAALFVSQLVGVNLSLGDQLLLVLTSIVASVGAAGIPRAGLVTMTFVFDSVGLGDYKGYIAVLLAVDWFLDRCRTTINVLGDVNVSCMLDGPVRQTSHDEREAEELSELLDDDQPQKPESVEQ